MALTLPTRVQVITPYPIWQTFGGVLELFAEEAARAGRVVRPNSQGAIFRLMLERRLIFLVLRNDYVTNATAERIAGLSRQRCSETFFGKVETLREQAFPLVTLTIRTANRAWVEQREG